MKLELKPEIVDVAKRQGTAATRAGMSRDGQISWVYQSGFLEVTHLRRNEILATYRFGKAHKDGSTVVTCVTDLVVNGEHVLLVGTCSGAGQAVLNLFSVEHRKVVRAIEIPYKVTALDALFANVEEEEAPAWVLNKHLQFFSGLVAVGTEAGYVYLVDLCLDDLAEDHPSVFKPKKLVILSPSILDAKSRRQDALRYDKHIALLLDEECHNQGYFYYRRQDDSVQKIFREDEVVVTSLKYMAQAGTLAVGFNFGSFQLWKLYNPVLDYSSRFNPDCLPVTHFVVQEPENDPRNFVYLWVGHGDDSNQSSIASISMYQLSFARKNVYSNFGMFYDELESVCARLDHSLTTDPYTSDTATSSSSLVTCYTIVNPYFSPPSKLSDSFDEGLHSNDLSLSIFVWRAESKQVVRHWMTIFDLNRWYHAQMPHTVRCHGTSLQICSYWAAYNLDEVVPQTSPLATLLGAFVSGDEVLRFINYSPLPPEEHSYPSALQLTNVRFQTSDGCVRTKCCGWQGQLLSQFAQLGPEILIDPADFYHQCHRAKLLPQNYEDMKTGSPENQRLKLLNMALDHHLTSSLIPRCILHWAEGEFANQGCSLNFLLGWAWSRVVHIKKLWDSTCEVLYDWSGHHVDPRTAWKLESLAESLASLKQIFSSLEAHSSPTTQKGQAEMELRQETIQLLLLHCHLVRWCVSFNLLPEMDENADSCPGLFAYPIQSLRETYNKKRAELSHRTGTVKELSLLLIDNLVDSQGPHIHNVWKALGGDGLYPPPSLQAVVNMYLIEEVSTEVKHAITLYLLHDLNALSKGEAGQAIILGFIHRFLLSPGLIHQVQGLWFIDHRDFEEGVRQLVNPNIHEDLGGSWKHVAVVNTLLAQSQGKAATRYLHTKRIVGGTPQEQQLYISVLLNNKQVSQALEYMRSVPDGNRRQILEHLLQECHKYKLLGHLLQLTLTETEEFHLELVLRQRAEPHALEPLLLYYLHHSKFQLAFQLNEDLKKMDRLEASLVSQERASTRNRLMDAYLTALPDVTRKLLLEKQRGSLVLSQRVEVQRPRPLSTSVHKPDLVAMSRSQFVMAVLDRVAEAQGNTPQADREGGGPLTEVKNDVIFLSTPKTQHQKTHFRTSELIYQDLKQSPLGSNPLSAMKRKILLESKQAHLNGNVGLKQLTEECLQLLRTPVRSHQSKLDSPALISTVSITKTPQSILKVQRLNKSILTNSKERLSARRSPASKPSRLSFVTSSVQRRSPASSPTSMDTLESSPLTASTDNTAAVKQLRFVGVSPSPTPSPTTVTEFPLHAEHGMTFEVREMTASVSRDPRPDVVRVSADSSQEDSLDVSSSVGDDFIGQPGRSPKSDRFHLEPTLEGQPDRSRLSQAHPQGSSDRYHKEMEELVRPDLLSPWKDELTSDKSWASSPSPSRSPEAVGLAASFKPPPGSKDTQNSSVFGQLVGSKQSVTSARSTHISWDQKLESTTRHVQLMVESSQTISSTFQSSTSLMPDLSLTSKNLSSVWPSSRRLSLTSELLEVDTTVSGSGRSDSPPLTPPSSKRAKFLESQAKEMEMSSSRRRLHSSPDKSEEEESRRRKTPIRKSPARKLDQEEPLNEEVPLEVGMRARRTPERRSPSRRLQKMEEKVCRQEDADTTKEMEDQKALSRDEIRKTRKSPSRGNQVQAAGSAQVDEWTQPWTGEHEFRKTPEGKVPLQITHVEMDESFSRRKSQRRSPSRNITEEPISPENTLEATDTVEVAEVQRVGEESPGKTREGQLRRSQKSEVGGLNVTSLRSLRKTPDRQMETNNSSKKSELGDQIKHLSENIPIVENHQEVHSVLATDVGKGSITVLEDVHEKKDSPEVPDRRRSTRLKTPERTETGGLRLGSLSPAGSRKRETRTPQRLLSLAERDLHTVETPSPKRKSARKSVSSSSHIAEERKATLPSINVVEESLLNQSLLPQEMETTMGGRNLRRSTRQSKTPDRAVTSARAPESSTPSRSSYSLRASSAHSPGTPSKRARAVHSPEAVTPSKRAKKVPKKTESAETREDEEMVLADTKPSSSVEPNQAMVADAKSGNSFEPTGGELTAVSSSQDRCTQNVTTEKDQTEVTSGVNQSEVMESSEFPDVTREEQSLTGEAARSRETAATQILEEEQSGQLEEPRTLRERQLSPGRARQSLARDTQLLSPDIGSSTEEPRPVGRQTRSPARQIRSPARQTRSPAKQIRSSARETRSPARQTKSPERETDSTARHSPKEEEPGPVGRQTRSPARETRSPARQTRSSERDTSSPARETRSPARQTRTPVRETTSPARQTRSPARETRSPIRQTSSPESDTDSTAKHSPKQDSTPPIRHTRSPARQTRSSERDTNSPARETRSPAREIRSPTRETRSPARQTRLSERDNSSPVRQTKSPARETSSPARETRSPARETRSPARQTRLPARDTSSPVRETKSPARETRSPARQTRSSARDTRSPARQTRSPARQTKSPSLNLESGDVNTDNWDQEMPALRLEVESDVEEEGTRSVAEQEEMSPKLGAASSQSSHHNKASPEPTVFITSNTPVKVHKSSRTGHKHDLAERKSTAGFVFSPPLKQTLHVTEVVSASTSEKPQLTPRQTHFTFSQPTPVAGDDTHKKMEVELGNQEEPQATTRQKMEVELGNQGEPQATTREETQQKRKKKRTLLTYSPILLSPISPVARKSLCRALGYQKTALAKAQKSQAPRVRRIKPSTWKQPTTSRQ